MLGSTLFRSRWKESTRSRFKAVFWSEREIQQQLQGTVRNGLVYSRIVADLAKHMYNKQWYNAGRI